MARKTIHNKITDAESLAQVNPENIRLMDDFAEYLRSGKKSEATISVYRSDLKIAFVWCLKNIGNKAFTDWTKRDVVAFQSYLIQTNRNSPARVRRIKATLSSLSNFIENVCDDEYPEFRNIIHKIESPPSNPVREKTVWDEDELNKLLEQLTKVGKYDVACFVALAMYSGRRKAELCRFRVSDFADDKLVCDGALYKSAPILSKGMGGGKSINCYTLAKKFKPYLDRWMQYRKEHGIKSEWLFPRSDDPKQQIRKSNVDSWALTLQRLTGRNFYFHSLRHYFTTELSRAGIPDSVIQTIMAWESADMVNVYKDIDADESIAMYFSGGEINAPKKSIADM